MAKQGRAGPALATAAIGSFVAGTVSTIGLMLLAPTLASVATSFGAAEYFLLMLLALSMVSSLTTGSALKAAYEESVWRIQVVGNVSVATKRLPILR